MAKTLSQATRKQENTQLIEPLRKDVSLTYNYDEGLSSIHRTPHVNLTIISVVTYLKYFQQLLEELRNENM